MFFISNHDDICYSRGEGFQCSNTPGSFECTCKDGFVATGSECQDIDECELSTHACPENSDCSNISGQYFHFIENYISNIIFEI